jgi:hypothetical protein
MNRIVPVAGKCPETAKLMQGGDIGIFKALLLKTKL